MAWAKPKWSVAISGIDWLELPCIYKASQFQGISPQNMNWHMVLAYLHFRGIPFEMASFAQFLGSTKVDKKQSKWSWSHFFWETMDQSNTSWVHWSPCGWLRSPRNHLSETPGKIMGYITHHQQVQDFFYQDVQIPMMTWIKIRCIPFDHGTYGLSRWFFNESSRYASKCTCLCDVVIRWNYINLKIVDLLRYWWGYCTGLG